MRRGSGAPGASIQVPTLEGKVQMKVPPGTQSGRVFRLKGRGIRPLQGGARGDQRVRVIVETPTQLTREQRELLEKLADATPDGEGLPQTRSFVAKMKELFD